MGLQGIGCIGNIVTGGASGGATSVVTDNLDGTYTHDNGNGVLVVINTNASSSSVVDAGGYFTSSDVEDVLQEIGAASHVAATVDAGSNPALTISGQELDLDLSASGSFSAPNFTADNIQDAIIEAAEGDEIVSSEIVDTDLATAGIPLTSDINSFVAAGSLTNQYVYYIGSGSANEPDFVWFINPNGDVIRLEKPVPSGGSFTWDFTDGTNTATYDSANPAKDFIQFVGATVDPLTNTVTIGSAFVVNTVTADTAFTNEDVFLVDASANTVNITVNPTSLEKRLDVRAIDLTNTVTITPSSGLIDGLASVTLTLSVDSATIISDGTNLHIL